MIALPQRLPHVLWQNRRLVPLSEGWLAESIEYSAWRAGYPEWKLAAHMARAVALYLEEECSSATVTVEALKEILRKSLSGIGFAEVAEKSVILPPRVSIYLPELAHQTGYEILFFPLLAERLTDALGYRVRGVKLEGLRDCVKILDAAPKWRHTCQTMSEQIISFSRAQLNRDRLNTVELLIC